MLPVFLLSGFSIIAQSKDCQPFHTGNFKVTTKETGTTLIHRENGMQVEENEEMGAKMIFSVDWIDECTYELRPTQVIKGDKAMLNKNFVITVHITDIKSHSYVAESTGNFFEGIMRLKIEAIE